MPLYSLLHACGLNHEAAVPLASYARQEELACLGVLVAHLYAGGAIGVRGHFARVDAEFLRTKEQLTLGVLCPPLDVLLGAGTVSDSEDAAASETFLLVFGIKMDGIIE